MRSTSMLCSSKHPTLVLGGLYAGAGVALAGLTLLVIKGLRLGELHVGSTLGVGALTGAALGAMTSVAATQGCVKRY